MHPRVLGPWLLVKQHITIVGVGGVTSGGNGSDGGGGGDDAAAAQ